MWDFLDPIKGPNVVQGVDTRGKSSMQTENLIVDKGSQGEVVEEIGEEFPNIRVAIFPQTFVVEAVDLRDLAGFVVAAQDGDALRVADFERDEEGDSLDGVVASINVIA